MFKTIAIAMIILSGSAQARCNFQTALDALQDYYTENIDASRFDEYVDPTFARAISKEVDEQQGTSFLFLEKTDGVFEGTSECQILGIRYRCDSSTMRHEYRACDKI